MNGQNIVKSISTLFPTRWHNATKFGVNQILMAITLASISGVSRISRIAAFSGDGLVKALLKLNKSINQNSISATLKGLGQKGAAKGYNSTKKGAKSYHPLLVFVSEMKLLYHKWFQTGSAYTSNGIVGFLQEVKASLPKTIKKVFFSADSGFFSGILLDLLESFNWDYLIKVKLKNLEKLLQIQTWTLVKGQKDIAICEFSYKANGWNNPRILKAMRSVKEYVQVEYLGEEQIVPVYQYVCYASNYDVDAVELHELYKQRSVSETWIEQVKGHTMAGSTLIDNFWANDILWQLNVLAYNLSVMMRQKKSKFKKQ